MFFVGNRNFLNKNFYNQNPISKNVVIYTLYKSEHIVINVHVIIILQETNAKKCWHPQSVYALHHRCVYHIRHHLVSYVSLLCHVFTIILAMPPLLLKSTASHWKKLLVSVFLLLLWCHLLGFSLFTGL